MNNIKSLYNSNNPDYCLEFKVKLTGENRELVLVLGYLSIHSFYLLLIEFSDSPRVSLHRCTDGSLSCSTMTSVVESYIESYSVRSNFFFHIELLVNSSAKSVDLSLNNNKLVSLSLSGLEVDLRGLTGWAVRNIRRTKFVFKDWKLSRSGVRVINHLKDKRDNEIIKSIGTMDLNTSVTIPIPEVKSESLSTQVIKRKCEALRDRYDSKIIDTILSDVCLYISLHFIYLFIYL